VVHSDQNDPHTIIKYPNHYAPHAKYNLANLIGFQVFRIFVYLIKGPGKRLSANFGKQGCRVIKNFLDEKEYSYVSKKVRDLLEKIDYVQTCRIALYPNGVMECLIDCEGHNPQKKIIKDDKGIYASVIQILENNKFNENFENYGCPSISIESIRVAKGDTDFGDVNQKWHGDRYEECYKAFLFLSDQSKDNGTMEYWPGSHVMGLRKLLYEYVHSVNYLFNSVYPRALLNKFRVIFNKKKLDVKSKQYIKLAGTIFQPRGEPLITEFPKNTLFISNQAAFHRRGVSREGSHRLQINLCFYHLNT
jgi:hypothetical protein